MWNPVKYLEFADERSRPFFDLVARVAAKTRRRSSISGADRAS